MILSLVSHIPRSIRESEVCILLKNLVNITDVNFVNNLISMAHVAANIDGDLNVI